MMSPIKTICAGLLTTYFSFGSGPAASQPAPDGDIPPVCRKIAEELDQATQERYKAGESMGTILNEIEKAFNSAKREHGCTPNQLHQAKDKYQIRRLQELLTPKAGL